MQPACYGRLRTRRGSCTRQSLARCVPYASAPSHEITQLSDANPFPDPARGDDFIDDELRYTEVSVISPMELLMSKEHLIVASEQKLQELRNFVGLDPSNPGHQTWVRHGVQQVVDWLAWLRKEPHERIAVSVYPTQTVDELIPDVPALTDEEQQTLLDELNPDGENEW